MFYYKIFPNFFLITLFNWLAPSINIESGEKLFIQNCSVCHLDGLNIIIAEKNLKKETLKENGMYNIDSISYQIINGKNGMPAFGGRLNSIEITNIANYVLEKSENNFQK
jgi:cytochrome c6